MKMKGLVYVLVLLTIVGSAFAISANDECKANGYAYGIAKYTWNATDAKFELEVQAVPPADVYDIKLTENLWDAFPAISGGVIVSSGGQAQKTAGGGSGIIPAGTESLTFCGNNFRSSRHSTAGSSTPNNVEIVRSNSIATAALAAEAQDSNSAVPEFSTMTLGVAILGVGLGLALLRKR